MLILLRANVPFGFAQLQFSEQQPSRIGGSMLILTVQQAKEGLGQVVLSYGFDQLRLHRITGRVLAKNLPSINFHKHLGFVEEGSCVRIIAQKMDTKMFIYLAYNLMNLRQSGAHYKI